MSAYDETIAHYGAALSARWAEALANPGVPTEPAFIAAVILPAWSCLRSVGWNVGPSRTIGELATVCQVELRYKAPHPSREPLLN